MQATKILGIASVVEAATGLALMIAPALVVTLLLGVELSGDLMPLGRVAGVAVFTVGLACWPGPQPADSGSPGFRAMLVYNALVALYFVYIGVAGQPVGLLLWPAAAWHVLVTLLLARLARNERGTRSSHSA